MVKPKNIKFLTGVVLWGIFVMALVVYLFFPYQKALKLAIQNVVGGGKNAVSMEGVTMKPMGIKANRILFKPEASTGQATPFELSKVNITWNPLSLIRGKLTIYSQAVLYDGRLKCTVDGIPVTGSSSPNIFLKLDQINIAKSPEGMITWFKGITGTLDGTVKKQVPISRPEKQAGSFQLSLKHGEIRDLQVKNMPRLVIPYRQILLEGKMDGSRIDVSKIAVTSDVVSLTGSGTIDTGDQDQIDMKLAYNALSPTLPLRGKGTITISGNPASPNVTVTPAQDDGAAAAPVGR